MGVIEGRRKEIPYLILLFLPAGSQWLQMAVRGVEFRRNKMKVKAVFALAGSGNPLPHLVVLASVIAVASVG
ncbi:hypothetical protein EV426DRAFT_586014 [Tirmania nivea]|nr:hypothetical protein EV426DRAFT_586014 [Tirmania nivea]